MIFGINFFDQPVKNNLKTYDNIWKITTSQRDDYTTGCVLGYNYFNKYYKIIAIDLSKQQALNANPKTLQKNEFYRKYSSGRKCKYNNVFHYWR